MKVKQKNDCIPNTLNKKQQQLKKFTSFCKNKSPQNERNTESGDFISTIFTMKKENDNFRTIINLKYLNKYVPITILK